MICPFSKILKTALLWPQELRPTATCCWWVLLCFAHDCLRPVREMVFRKTLAVISWIQLVDFGVLPYLKFIFPFGSTYFGGSSCSVFIKDVLVGSTETLQVSLMELPVVMVSVPSIAPGGEFKSSQWYQACPIKGGVPYAKPWYFCGELCMNSGDEASSVRGLTSFSWKSKPETTWTLWWLHDKEMLWDIPAT